MDANKRSRNVRRSSPRSARSPWAARHLVVIVRKSLLWALVLVLPLPALADRGALTLELGGNIAGLRIEPELGLGRYVVGTTVGVDARARYAFTNWLEVTSLVAWTASAPFVHENVSINDPNGTFQGELHGNIGRYELLTGVRFGHGLGLRTFGGVEAGAALTSVTKLDFVDPSNGQSYLAYGWTLPNRTRTSFVLASNIGVEWALSDHWSLSVGARMEWLTGSPRALAVTVPVTIGHSWYRLW